jgi:hypothetical protein
MAQRDFNSLEPLDRYSEPSAERPGAAADRHPLGEDQTATGAVSPTSLGRLDNEPRGSPDYVGDANNRSAG